MQFKKILLAGAVAAVASSQVMAGDIFIGGVYGRIGQDMNLKSNGTTLRSDITDARIENKLENRDMVGFRLGTWLNDNTRIYGNFILDDKSYKKRHSTDSGNTTSESYRYKNYELSLSADYVIPLTDSGNTQFYAGGTVGLNKLKYSQSQHADKVTSQHNGSRTKRDTALMYGVQAGFLQNLTDNLSAELGYRYTRSNNEITGTFNGERLKLESKSQQSAFLALNYSF
ncbi:outer membrane protein [Endozoicomonas arenosclerae]|uniref:outer membrane protein n=1 Tax=Endozoicomonas arenosclerae TaxID=1633495 RepID=UPI0007849B2F|nr:outer membrane beta-barrel protein [Endozoicomonas arenosclerae]